MEGAKDVPAVNEMHFVATGLGCQENASNHDKGLLQNFSGNKSELMSNKTMRSATDTVPVQIALRGFKRHMWLSQNTEEIVLASWIVPLTIIFTTLGSGTIRL